MSEPSNVHDIGSQSTHLCFPFKAAPIKGHEKGKYKFKKNVTQTWKIGISRHLQDSTRNVLSLFEKKNEKWRASSKQEFF